jgi:hypothetical protein
MSAGPSVYPNVTAREPLNRFSLNLILRRSFTETCRLPQQASELELLDELTVTGFRNVRLITIKTSSLYMFTLAEYHPYYIGTLHTKLLVLYDSSGRETN